MKCLRECLRLVLIHINRISTVRMHTRTINLGHRPQRPHRFRRWRTRFGHFTHKRARWILIMVSTDRYLDAILAGW
ncbi:hypothetical protein I7I53_05714 [Histoplasma capsulatum var. duboisii H88]|uniref:Uncharacterized protein n=1 Tax=Ajellomyces capsulatus (strain H88) TaxID=544711 RepID=A0A8A1LYP0_AJEC8|nr:hypothetical protein I7I53_05714 [Histoplasma capsulatum var. duboisii H88]